MKLTFAAEDLRVRITIDEARELAGGAELALELVAGAADGSTFELNARDEGAVFSSRRSVLSIAGEQLREAIARHPSTVPVAEGAYGKRTWSLEVDLHSRSAR